MSHTKNNPAKKAATVDKTQAENDARMQPGHVETDETTGQRVIHPVANPQQVNPLGSDEHEKAAVAEAKVLTDQKSTSDEKAEATEKSNAAQREASGQQKLL